MHFRISQQRCAGLSGSIRAGATGLAMSRIGGFALLAQGIAFWPPAASGITRARTVLLVYSALVTFYLGVVVNVVLAVALLRGGRAQLGRRRI